MATKEKEPGMLSNIMTFIRYILGIVSSWMKRKQLEAEQNDRKEIRENEAAKKEVEERNEAETLAERLKNTTDPEERKRILHEIRKKVAK